MSLSHHTIGILGDGQLAMMLGEAAHKRRIPFVALSQDANSSFARRFPNQWLKSLPSQLKAITLENEFLSVAQLAQVELETTTPITPGPRSFSYFENKIAQRTFYDSLNIPSPRWGILNSASTYSSPVVLKTSQGGYDGYGVRFASDPGEFALAVQALQSKSSQPLLWEERVAIKREFAQGVLLDGKGGFIRLPLFETIQRNGICVLVASRSSLPNEEWESVKAQCSSILDRLSNSTLCGLFHFEFFYTDAGQVLINEGAPRPHNSAHLTQDASEWSQFDLLIEFLNQGQLPLPSGTQIHAKAGIMVNLLGTGEPGEFKWNPGPENSPRIPGLTGHPHLYYKHENRRGRKMGHVNYIAENTAENTDASSIDPKALIAEGLRLGGNS
jgi:5-(carboxyamino)imidazole ribonucleotide synthase